MHAALYLLRKEKSMCSLLFLNYFPYWNLVFFSEHLLDNIEKGLRSHETSPQHQLLSLLATPLVQFLRWNPDSWPLWEPTSQGSPHLQTQLQAVSVLSSLYPSLISFSSFKFPGASCRIFLPFLPWLPCHFYRCDFATTRNGKQAVPAQRWRDK